MLLQIEINPFVIYRFCSIQLIIDFQETPRTVDFTGIEIE